MFFPHSRLAVQETGIFVPRPDSSGLKNEFPLSVEVNHHLWLSSSD